MFKRMALVALSCFMLVPAAPRFLDAQSVRHLSKNDAAVLINELRVRLNLPDTAKATAPAPARVSDDEYESLLAAGLQALKDFNDPSDLNAQEACAAQFGARDQAGALLRKTAHDRNDNLDLLKNSPDLFLLLDAYAQRHAS